MNSGIVKGSTKMSDEKRVGFSMAGFTLQWESP